MHTTAATEEEVQKPFRVPQEVKKPFLLPQKVKEPLLLPQEPIFVASTSVQKSLS